MVGEDGETHESEDGGAEDEEEEEGGGGGDEANDEKADVDVKQEDAVEAGEQQEEVKQEQLKQEPEGLAGGEGTTSQPATTAAVGAAGSGDGGTCSGAVAAAADGTVAGKSVMEEEALGTKAKGVDEEEEAQVLNDASRDALAAQPTGYTLATSKVRAPCKWTRGWAGSWL